MTPALAGGRPLSDRSEGREYFRHGRFRVTEDMVRARTKSIQLSTIEGVEVTRPLAMLALAGCTGLAGLGIVFGDLLYPGEIAFALILAALMILLAWNTGTLRVFSKLTRDRGWGVVWWIRPLHRMRDAIEAAIEDRSRPRRSSPPPQPPLSHRALPQVAEPDDDETIRIVMPRPRQR
jgi:hypothetical protein